MKAFKNIISMAAFFLAATLAPSCTDVGENFEPSMVTYPDFTISDFEPKTGSTNTELTITGVNFGDYSKAAKVYLGDLEISSFLSYSDTEIVVNVPSTATSGKVKVKVWNYEHETAEDFIFVPGPEIESISNSQTIAGAVISIYGELFGEDAEAVTVYFTGKGDEQYAEAKVVSVTDGEIQVEVPVAGANGPICLLVDGFNIIPGPDFFYPICIQYLFDTDGDTEGWYAGDMTTPATLELRAEDGGLKIVYDLENPTDNGKIRYNRIDLMVDDVYMDPAKYPILALKWVDRPQRTFWMRSAIGDFTNADGKSTNGNYDGIMGINQDVVYYDLRNGFANGDMYGYDITKPFLLENLYWTATEETSTGVEFSKIEWVNNFESVEALDEYLAGLGESTSGIPTPVIESLSATTAAVGETISLYGSNFGTNIDDLKVTFSPKAVAEIVSVTDTEIQVIVPEGGVTGVITVNRISKEGYSPEFTYPLVSNIHFDFDTDGNTEGWYNAGAYPSVNLSVSSGALNIDYDTEMFVYCPAQIRADNLIVDPVNYPIIAVKWEDAPVSKCNLNTNLGYFDNNGSAALNYTGAQGQKYDIFYYDLTAGFGGTVLTEATILEYIEWEISEHPAVSGVESSKIQWINQFASVEAMEAYLEEIGDLAGSVILSPEISSLSATEGYLGELLTINGNNFGADKEAITVNFGSVEAPILSLTNTQISVMIPDGAQDGAITVTKAEAENVATSATTFDYHEPSVRNHFDTDGDLEGWQDDSDPKHKGNSELYAAGGHLVLDYDWVNPTLSGSTAYNRLDVASPVAKLDADVNPILAVKWINVNHFSLLKGTFRLNLEGLGFLENNTKTPFKVTGKKGKDADVVYFDLKKGFGSDFEIPTSENADSYSLIEFVTTMKDTTAATTEIDWIMTFSSVEALDNYLESIGE